jgi:hypothetical protein
MKPLIVPALDFQMLEKLEERHTGNILRCFLLMMGNSQTAPLPSG